MSLTSVQRWVGSILAVSTIFHLAFGLDLAAWFLAANRAAAAFSLLGLAVVVGVIAMSVGLAIHRHQLLSWWLLIAPIPALIGVVVLMARWS